MVRYEYLDKMGEWIRYKYFPEDKKDWGIVSVRPETRESVIDTLAKGDAIHRVKIEEIGYVTVSSYAGHAIDKIIKKIEEGEIPKCGMAIWY